MARVADKRRARTAGATEVPREDVGAADVLSPRGTGRLPEPFGLLAGQIPDVSADDIKIARRNALAAEDRC